MNHCGERQIFLALEVVKEAAFGEAGFVADILDPGRGVSLRAHHLEGRVEDSCCRRRL
jgi:hypothetical protein